MRTDRRGFSIIELLVVAVLGTLILMAAYQVLITNQRTYTVQNAHIGSRQISRAALDVLATELREVNPVDLVGMGSEQVTFRAQRTFGLVCDVVLPALGSSPVLDVVRVGDWFESGDSVTVFADNREGTPRDDAWILAEASLVDPTITCDDGSPAQQMTFTGQSAAFLADTVRAGAPVRSFVHYTYGRFDLSGETYVARQRAGGSVEPLVGPIPATFAAGVPSVEFVYLDADGNGTAVAADVRQIEIRVRIRSEARGAAGDVVADSLTTRVQLRN